MFKMDVHDFGQNYRVGSLSKMYLPAKESYCQVWNWHDNYNMLELTIYKSLLKIMTCLALMKNRKAFEQLL